MREIAIGQGGLKTAAERGNQAAHVDRERQVRVNGQCPRRDLGGPAVPAAWKDATFPSDRPWISNTRGRVTFAQGTQRSSHTTQVCINYGDNSRLDIDGFAPFSEVVSSLILAERLFSEYGEGPDQGRIILEGNALRPSRRLASLCRPVVALQRPRRSFAPPRRLFPRFTAHSPCLRG